jgi:2'-5' RNA ligase
MSDTLRCFLALEIPDDTRALLAQRREELKAALPAARWVRPEGQHLTLKFLGEVAQLRLDGLVRDLAPELQALPKVRVQLGGAGFFPSPSRPRVAWIGGRADGASAIFELIEETAERHEFPRERRKWALHLTQARLRRPWPRSAVERFLSWGEGLALDEFTASEVVLFSSSLRPSGAVYTALERMPLA